jgi:hypothetical protein
VNGVLGEGFAALERSDVSPQRFLELGEELAANIPEQGLFFLFIFGEWFAIVLDAA